MSLRRVLLLLAVLLLAAVTLATPTPSASQGVLSTQNIVSDSYYRLDPATGTMKVRVEATLQNTTLRDLNSVTFWAMPGAQDVQLLRGKDPVEVTVAPEKRWPLVNAVTSKLERGIRPRAQVDFVLTYNVPASTNEYVRLEAGSIESMFVSQGRGSFVFIDVPKAAENYFDPGCLRANDQPGEVKSAGYERWVCGEAALIALNADDPSTLKQCADLAAKCRQQLLRLPFSAFAQSISDTASRALLETDLDMGEGRKVKLVLRYFKREQVWADRQFNIARQAFPRLEQVFGFPFPFETITMRQSHHIEIIGAAGIAFSRIGEVLLSTDTGFDDYVTIHELAHQWAGNQLETSGLWEGLAEYGTRRVAPELGVPLFPWGWDQLGYPSEPLALWYNGSDIYDPRYWYGKAGAFWATFAQEIGGPENMTRVLAQVDDDPKKWPLTGRWFFDAGERASGANLDALFLRWVYDQLTSRDLIAARRQVYTDVAALVARAATYGLAGEPAGLRPNLDAWNFDAASRDVAYANQVFNDYQKVFDMAHLDGLPISAGVSKSWSAESLIKTAEAVESQRQAVFVLRDAATALAEQPESSYPLKQMEEARTRYEAGEFAEASRIASEAVADSINSIAAARMIEKARERQQSFDTNLINSIGLWRQNPEGDLERAIAAQEAGRGSEALKYAGRAYDTWGTATAQGWLRLAFLMAVNCLLSFGLYYLLRRFDLRRSKPKKARGRASAKGKMAGTPAETARASSWRDWENRA